MPEKTYIVRFKPREESVQPVLADTVEVDDRCLLFLREDGTLSAFSTSMLLKAGAKAATSAIMRALQRIYSGTQLGYSGGNRHGAH